MIEELADGQGVILRRDAIAVGYDDNALARLVRAKRIVRIRHGAYVPTELWSRASAEHRHRMLSAAVLRQYDDNIVLSHVSALIEQGGPTCGLNLDDVHVTHLRGGGRRSAKIVHHEGGCRVGDVTRDGRGFWITAPGRTVLDTASGVPVEVGVCIADDFLHRGLTSLEDLMFRYDHRPEWPGDLHLRSVLQLCDGRSESVGETLSRQLFKRMNLPTPELQWEVFHPDGRLAGRTDFAWPHYRLLCEFDGRTKYLRYRRPGESIEDAVLREKRREDLLRELTGYLMIRLVWADLYVQEATAQRIRRLMAQAA
jgi:hypothetical protein